MRGSRGAFYLLRITRIATKVAKASCTVALAIAIWSTTIASELYNISVVYDFRDDIFFFLRILHLF